MKKDKSHLNEIYLFFLLSIPSAKASESSSCLHPEAYVDFEFIKFENW